MIIDSDILIYASRNQEQTLGFLIQSGESETLYITAISYVELLAGARDKIEQRRIEKFLNRFVLLTVDDSASRRAIELVKQYHLSHGLELPDAFIAAIALERKESLATHNIQDFRFIKNLAVISPDDPTGMANAD